MTQTTTHKMATKLVTDSVSASTGCPRYEHEIICSCGWSAIRFTATGANDVRDRHFMTRNAATR